MADGVAVEAAGLSIRTKRGPVISEVSFRLGPGEIGVACGSGGCGRTSLLLAAGARMRLFQGVLTVADRALPGAGGWVRRHSSVCAGPDIDPLVDNMRVGEELRRAELFAGRRGRRPLRNSEIFDLVGLDVDMRALVGDLSPPDRTRLRFALGLVADVPLLILDDLGDQVPQAGHELLWNGVRDAVDATALCLRVS